MGVQATTEIATDDCRQLPLEKPAAKLLKLLLELLEADRTRSPGR